MLVLIGPLFPAARQDFLENLGLLAISAMKTSFEELGPVNGPKITTKENRYE
jgi:hypothetical protein